MRLDHLARVCCLGINVVVLFINAKSFNRMTQFKLFYTIAIPIKHN